MLEVFDRGSLRGLRDRAMLLVGFAGGLRCSEIVVLDLGRDQTQDGLGWVEVLDKGLVVTLRGKTGWREFEIGRGSSDATCPIVSLETWLKFARLVHGPIFRRVTGSGKTVGRDRLNDREVARLVKRTTLATGVRGDLTEGKRREAFAGHSLRAGLASTVRDALLRRIGPRRTSSRLPQLVELVISAPLVTTETTTMPLAARRAPPGAWWWSWICARSLGAVRSVPGRSDDPVWLERLVDERCHQFTREKTRFGDTGTTRKVNLNRGTHSAFSPNQLDRATR